MRISDWSSDVCSSDLGRRLGRFCLISRLLTRFGFRCGIFDRIFRLRLRMILNGCGRMLDGTNAVIVRRDCRVACGETLLEMLDGPWKHILRDLILQIEAEHAA